ncbi:MAG: hypothetical protein HKN23_18665 [Verrucomicrobiales bacterium]|nr:hypothetical protein [Verrucomicrobiales bacterium]
MRHFIFSMAFAFAGAGFSAETEAFKKEGLTVQLASDVNAVVPGQKITVGFFIKHDPKYHTYWRSPGIVGVGSRLDWELPEGFKAGPIEWPAPIRTKMAQITAWGYESDTCLLSEIHVPKNVDGKSVTLKVKAAWMCCAATCHPGWQDFELTLPVSDSGEAERDEKWAKMFAKTRAAFPKSSPENWNFSAKKTGEIMENVAEIEAVFSIPKTVEMPEDFDWNEVYFFCDDNQVNSDEPQGVRFDPDRPHTVYLKLIGTSYGPKNPESVSGILFHPNGWPGLDTKWIEVSTPWADNDEQSQKRKEKKAKGENQKRDRTG